MDWSLDSFLPCRSSSLRKPSSFDRPFSRTIAFRHAFRHASVESSRSEIEANMKRNRGTGVEWIGVCTYVRVHYYIPEILYSYNKA